MRDRSPPCPLTAGSVDGCVCAWAFSLCSRFACCFCCVFLCVLTSVCGGGVFCHFTCVELFVDVFCVGRFAHQLSCLERSFQEWSEEVHRFEADLVVSNPPFFHNKPKSPFYARNLARHDDALPISDLLNGVAKILSKDGVFGIVWPVERESELLSAANDFNFKLVRRCEILPTKRHSPVRFLSEFKFSQQVTSLAICSNIVLETGEEKGRRNFTAEYNELMKDFFLDA